MNIPLEDGYTDIIGKAMRGLRLDDAGLAAQAGVSVEALQTLRGGSYSAATAERIAPLLGINAKALGALAEQKYLPAAVSVDGLAMFNTPFEDMTVNAYLVWDPATKEAAVFDTGADASGILSEAQSRGLSIKHIFITHTHGDHIFDLDRLREKTGATVWSGDREPVEGSSIFSAGKSWQLGALKIDSRLTWGHSAGGITYVVNGLARPLAVVGDSIFAASMGGGGVSYADAVKCNVNEILTLPAVTVICPGHGPLTSVGEEAQNNPFFAK
jgi:glyoxylase-like metal-dependent hydrolase (beta-lactamase superfamily II)